MANGSEGRIRVISAEDKVLLYWWDWVYYGAHLHVDLFYYPGEDRFCYEGTLDFAGIVKLAEGDLCVTMHENGSFTVSGGCDIKIAGKKVAKTDGWVRSRVDWDEGMWYLEAYRLELCGSNTFELKCDTWEEGTFNPSGPREAPKVFLLRKGLARSEEEKTRALVSIFEPRQGLIRPSVPPTKP